jgi:hypothetical protein
LELQQGTGFEPCDRRMIRDRVRRVLCAAAGFGVAAALCTLTPALAAGPTGTKHDFGGSASTTLRYWSAERVRNAPDRSVRAGHRRTATPISRSKVRPGPPTRVRGRPPSRFLASASAAFPVPDPAAAPFRSAGKLLGRIDGDPYSCSATSISTPSRSVVLTAAHCLRDPGSVGQWARRVVFIPAFEAGSRPYGTFRATWGRVLSGFTAFNPKFDVGAFVVAADSRGKLGAVAGSRGWATGLSRDQSWSVFGYPANIANANRMQECDSGWYGNDLKTRGWPGPWPLRINCNMGHGASGGGWVTAGGLLNGVVDYGYRGRPDRLYGPYFGLAVRRLIGQMP